MSSFLNRLSPGRRTKHPHQVQAGDSASENSLKFVVNQAANDSELSYQEANGAPVEVVSTLGYAVGPVTIIFLNISKMIGTGIYSTPASILKGTGSVGLSLIFWFVGFLTSASSLSVYLEYAANFPNRSGSEAVYLEQAYPRPKWFFPVAFAFQSVVLSFSSGNAIVLAQYLFRMTTHSPTAWELKGVAIAGYTVAFLTVSFHTRFSYLASNAIGIVKTITLIFIAITGLVVLGGHTRVPNPDANFKNAFDGVATPYGVTNAMYKIIFAYAGFENAFNVVNEVRSPVKRLRTYGFIALLIVAILYTLTNIAFFAAVPKEDIAKSKQVAAALFFTAVFGESRAVRGLNFLIALSSFGNLVAVLLGQSRLLRECGRQGVLPWPKFWVSTKPFGTPLGPYTVKWALTIVMILAPPAGDAFNFITDLSIYPASVFNLLMATGIYVVRRHRKRLGLGRPSFRAWDIAIIFNIVVQTYVVVMPWYPPSTGRFGGDVSFWYATYVVVGIAIIALCGIYYVLYIVIIPRIRGYAWRQAVESLDDGSQTHRLVKIPLHELSHFDATHDAAGARIASSSSVEVIASDEKSGIRATGRRIDED